MDKVLRKNADAQFDCMRERGSAATEPLCLRACELIVELIIESRRVTAVARRHAL